MAHVKAVGSKARQGINIAGKRLGLKKNSGEAVKPGDIIVRQRGSKFHAGKNVYISRDFTIHAKVAGVVQFRPMTGYKQGQKYIDVITN